MTKPRVVVNIKNDAKSHVDTYVRLVIDAGHLHEVFNKQQYNQHDDSDPGLVVRSFLHFYNFN